MAEDHRRGPEAAAAMPARAREAMLLRRRGEAGHHPHRPLHEGEPLRPRPLLHVAAGLRRPRHRRLALEAKPPGGEALRPASPPPGLPVATARRTSLHREHRDPTTLRESRPRAILQPTRRADRGRSIRI